MICLICLPGDLLTNDHHPGYFQKTIFQKPISEQRFTFRSNTHNSPGKMNNVS
jgi:hypothetical protein